MKTIAIANLKGGVGKTTTVINLAHILAKLYAQRVLIIDLDIQANTSRFFNNQLPVEGLGISDVFMNKDVWSYTNLLKLLVCETTHLGLDIINSDVRITEVREYLAGNGLNNNLKNLLKKLESEYDYCIIDNAPSFDYLTIAALDAAEAVIIPVKLDAFCVDGLQDITDMIKAVESKGQSKTVRILRTMYSKTKVNEQGLEYLNAISEFEIMAAKIRSTTKINESTFVKKPIVHLARGCTAAQDYLEFTEELLGVLKND